MSEPDGAVPDKSTGDEEATAAAAARRNRGKRRPPPAGPPPAPVPTADGGEEAPAQVLVARTVVPESYLPRAGFPAIGDGTLYHAVIPPGHAAPRSGDYVTASCEVRETMIPPNSRTPVERTLWGRGWLVDRAVHEAVLRYHAHAVATGTVGQADGAALVDVDAPVAPLPGELPDVIAIPADAQLPPAPDPAPEPAAPST